MPEENFGFQPTKEVRTFGQILAHVAGANYVFCSAAKGEKSPHAEEAFEKTATTRAAINKALADWISYCDAAYNVNDRQLTEAVDLPFGQGKGPRSRALLGNVGHLNEHYGNLVTYFRIKGLDLASVVAAGRRQLAPRYRCRRIGNWQLALGHGEGIG